MDLVLRLLVFRLGVNPFLFVSLFVSFVVCWFLLCYSPSICPFSFAFLLGRRRTSRRIFLVLFVRLVGAACSGFLSSFFSPVVHSASSVPPGIAPGVVGLLPAVLLLRMHLLLGSLVAFGFVVFRFPRDGSAVLLGLILGGLCSSSASSGLFCSRPCLPHMFHASPSGFWGS